MQTFKFVHRAVGACPACSEGGCPAEILRGKCLSRVQAAELTSIEFGGMQVYVGEWRAGRQHGSGTHFWLPLDVEMGAKTLPSLNY